MQLPEGWEKIKVPLGYVFAVLGFCYAIWSYAEATYLKASDFKSYAISQEMRALTRQKAQLETDVLRLTAKRNLYPNQFDGVDKTILERQEQVLDEVRREIRNLERRQNGGNSNSN